MEDRNTAWPAHFESVTGHRTYNMGLSGWGPVEYVTALDSALRMNPRTVVVALYLGNDLFDSYQTVCVRRQHEYLGSPDAPTSIRPPEGDPGMFDEVLSLVTTGERKEPQPPPLGLLQQCRTFMSEHCRLYGTARALKDAIARAIDPDGVAITDANRQWKIHHRWAQRHPELGVAVDCDGFRTILTPPYRNLVLDLSDARIEEGLCISTRAVEKCLRRCREAGVDLHVVLIPTKESVFYELAKANSTQSILHDVVQNETRVRTRLLAFLQEHGIPATDALPFLHGCLRHGEHPYPISRDGHPNAIGHRAIAQAVAGGMRSHVATTTGSHP